MTNSAGQLEDAIFDKLAADITLVNMLGGKRIYGSPPRNSALPYVTVATTFSRDWSTGTERGEEHRILVTVWTAIKKRDQQQALLARLDTLLNDAALTLTDHHLINLRVERQELRSNRRHHLLQGVLQLRATTEHSIH